MCPDCEQPQEQCICGEATPPAAEVVLISLDTKGRKGKGVTLVQGLGLDKPGLDTLSKQMKKQCGVGGSVKDWTIEMQGDQRSKLSPLLEALGYRVKVR
ncbi:stress response translation initiation inhibitor YciH [Allohahella marinimesophila]|uniref:Stress response translation initiation inhibitor YciH n=2 Tax=Allohahella marinimesophila TaxID=1054972 RepID=A0ABP7NM25_9GAMM